MLRAVMSPALLVLSSGWQVPTPVLTTVAGLPRCYALIRTGQLRR
jgi:hypothetical protein